MKERASVKDLEMELWLRRRNSGLLRWTTRSGEEIALKDMSDEALIAHVAGRLAVEKIEHAARWLHEHGFKRVAREPLNECVVARNGSVEMKFDGEAFMATELDTMVCGPKCKDPKMALEGLEKFFSDHAESVRKVLMQKP